MPKVYYKKINSNTKTEEIKKISRELLEKVVDEEKVKLASNIPLKVHFGEPGNNTFLKPQNYDGIIDYLESKNIQSEFMETLVVYGGRRNTKEEHMKVAEEHGFTSLPVVIADGNHGEAFDEIAIGQKHFANARIGQEFQKYDQFIVLSHFKGHSFAGFGGAIKQLSMGFAAKGGKLAMHMGIKPRIKNRKCVKCKICQKACNVDAIVIDKKARIDHEKCIGCGGCFAVCPKKAISLMPIKGIYRAVFKREEFREKLVEYALAAQKGKRNIYITFVMNVTANCDCVGKNMKPLMDDIGIFASTDPVAIDDACYQAVKNKGKAFKGHKQLEYAEKIGLGRLDYELVEV